MISNGIIYQYLFELIIFHACHILFSKFHTGVFHNVSAYIDNLRSFSWSHFHFSEYATSPTAIEISFHMLFISWRISLIFDIFIYLCIWKLLITWVIFWVDILQLRSFSYCVEFDMLSSYMLHTRQPRHVSKWQNKTLLFYYNTRDSITISILLQVALIELPLLH